MPLTTSALVAGVLGFTPTIDLSPYINAADVIVMDVCTDCGYSANQQQTIETWLAAHMASFALPQTRKQSERAGDTATTYLGKVGMGFESTFWGLTAMALDTAGGLARVNEGVKTGKLRKKYGIYSASRAWRRPWGGWFPGFGGWGGQ